MSVHFAPGYIWPLWCDERERALLLLQDRVAIHSSTLCYSVIAHAKRCSVHSLSILTRKGLAVEDCSQNNPISCKPAFVQNIIHPAPERLLACFLPYYKPSVVHCNVPSLILSAIQAVSCHVCWLLSISSHIKFLPQPAMNSQKYFCIRGVSVRNGPSCSLLTLSGKKIITDVGTSCRWGVEGSSHISW